MNLHAVVAARMGSERLPGKSMAILAGKPSFEHIATRLSRSRYLSGVVLATTDQPEDEPLRECARRLKVPYYAGSALDVLGRTLAAAKSVGVHHIVQVTGDCPLIDAAVVDRTIEVYLREHPDYASNGLIATYPNGMDTEVFATAILDEVEKLTNDPADREHVSLYIYEHPEHYRLLNVEAPPEHRRPDLRLTLDTREDYELISKLFDALYPDDPVFGLSKIIDWLSRNPELLNVNRHVTQRAART